MVVINYSGEEINAKIVYYGPGLSGKTTNLEFIYTKMPSEVKGKMVSMKTRTDRTLFFDFLPIELGDISGYRTRFLLYTVPGQVYYNATRKLVLKGADAVVFVADSSRSKLDENLESLRNLEENLNEHGLTLDTIPWVIQYNKRDMEDAMSREELEEQLNLLNVSSFEAVATEGTGIYETFQGIARLLYLELKKRFEGADEIQKGREKLKEPAAKDGVKSRPEVSVPRPDGGREMKRTAPARSPLTPPSRRTNGGTTAQKPAERPTEKPVARKGREAVSSVVDQALREVDSMYAFEREEDATASPSVEPTAEGDEYRFAPIDGMDEGLGRVLELEDTPSPMKAEVDEWDDSDRNGFIKDPCRTKIAEEKSADKVAKETPVEVKEKRISAREAHAPAAPAAEESELTIPIVISRSQVRKTVPLKLVLEIQISEDDE